MNLNNLFLLCVVTLLLTLFNFSVSAQVQVPIKISIAAPVSAPFVYQDESGDNQGFLVELIELVNKSTELEIDISIMPWARAMHEVKVDHIDALMPTIYTKERAQYLTFPKLPILSFNTVLLKRAEDNILVEDITTLGTEKVIVKIRDMSMGKTFDDAEKNAKINVIEVRGFDHAIQMLAQSRVDLVACVDYIAHSSLKRLNLIDKIDMLYFSDETTLAFFAFSSTFSANHDVNVIMNKINSVTDTSEYKALVVKFLK